MTIMRNKILRKHLKLALNSMVYGDRLFFECNKELYEADIVVKFNSKFNEYNVVENVGKIKDYKNSWIDIEKIIKESLTYN